MNNLIKALTVFWGLALCTVSMAESPFRIAVAGATHDHLWGVVSQLKQGDISVVGVWEADSRYIHDNPLSSLLPKTLFYSSLEAMLDETKPEAVVAYGSIKEHLQVVKACAPRGIHVMVEKPLAASLEDALEMAALAREHKILLLTNYETTWYASNHYVKEMTAANKLGPIFRMEIYDGHQGPIEIGCSKRFTDWLTDPILNGGGTVMDFGCYGANLATWLLDGRRPQRVYAVLNTIKPDVYPRVDDDATIVVEYPGITVQINASWCWPFGRKDMYVYGKDVCLYQSDPLHVRSIPGGDAAEVPSLKAPLDNPFHYLEAAVRGKITLEPQEPSALENNLIVMEILSAALQSARTGSPVDL